MITNSSETLGALAKALARVQAKLPSAAKSSTNPHLGNQYADLEAIWNAAQPLLGEAGIAVTQIGEENPVDGTVTMVTTLIHESNEWISSRMPVQPFPMKGLNALQSFGVAWSYCRRYSLAALLGVQTGEDTDGAGAGEPAEKNGEQKKRKPRKPAEQPPSQGSEPQPDQQQAATAFRAKMNELRVAHGDETFAAALEQSELRPDDVSKITADFRQIFTTTRDECARIAWSFQHAEGANSADSADSADSAEADPEMQAIVNETVQLIKDAAEQLPEDVVEQLIVDLDAPDLTLVGAKAIRSNVRRRITVLKKK